MEEHHFVERYWVDIGNQPRCHVVCACGKRTSGSSGEELDSVIARHGQGHRCDVLEAQDERFEAAELERVKAALIKMRERTA